MNHQDLFCSYLIIQFSLPLQAVSKYVNLSTPSRVYGCRHVSIPGGRNSWSTEVGSHVGGFRCDELRGSMEPELNTFLHSSLSCYTGWWFHFFFQISPRNLGKISNLTNIFQMSWNHQPEKNSNHNCKQCDDQPWLFYPQTLEVNIPTFDFGSCAEIARSGQ